MFQLFNNATVEEGENDFFDYLSSEDQDVELQDELPEPQQFVQVSNPSIETMLSDSGEKLAALIDLQNNFHAINPQSLIKEESPFSTPRKGQMPMDVQYETPLNLNKFQREIVTETPGNSRMTFGGKTITLYHREEEEEIDIEAVEDEELFINKKRKPPSQKLRGAKRNKCKPGSNIKATDLQKSTSVVYNILTRLDTPHTKAVTLEKNISKVFMGEELLRMQKNSEDEDEEIDIV